MFHCHNSTHSVESGLASLTLAIKSQAMNIFYTDTNVLSAAATAVGSNKILVTGVFGKNTAATAKGVLLVLQCEDGSPDEFRALPRPESCTTVNEIIDNIPPSTYNISLYGLGVSNSSPAYELNGNIAVNNESKYLFVTWILLILYGL